MHIISCIALQTAVHFFGSPGRVTLIQPGPDQIWFSSHFVLLEIQKIQNVVMEMKKCGLSFIVIDISIKT